MANKMDRGLDEIIADRQNDGPRERRGVRGGGAPRRPRRDDRRDDFPRDGVRKTFRNESSRNLDSEWVHDRYEDDRYHRAVPPPRRHRDSPSVQQPGAKLRIEDVHYDVTEEELEELFKRIGPITKFTLKYDRAGRSEGTAFVIYERKADAEEAIRQFDGANAYGQPIKVAHVPNGPGRNPFDNAVMPGKPLAERISGRARSLSPARRYTEEEAARKGIDRYVPGDNGDRSRSPAPRRRGGGRRPGARREGGERNQESRRGEGRPSNPRQKKTQEELDAEMADYFGGGADDSASGNATSTTTATAAATTATATSAPENGSGNAPAAAAVAAADDVDMIE